MSGIYIPGIEMPTRCGLCRFCIQEMTGDIDYRWECAATAETIKRKVKESGRLEGCPLIPVPYHRRLIDADALASMYDPNTDFGKSVRDMIEDCPTIIPTDKEDGE